VFVFWDLSGYVGNSLIIILYNKLPDFFFLLELMVLILKQSLNNFETGRCGLHLF
jgi:hypothetical protein